MKKTKKALASLAIAGMTLSMVPFNAFATGTVPTRISGDTAAQTAVAIADQTGWTGTAILASSASYGMVDALTAGPLASYLKAPILLTGPGSSLDSDTKAELTKLAVKTVYVTSGTAVISQSVLTELSGMGITVVPLGGADRAETSVNIAKKMTGVTKVAVANGLQDALSIAAIASAANEPILLTDKDAVPASVAAYLTANPAISTSDVIGGTGIISDAVKAKFPTATRHAGASAYDTNSQVIQDFDSSLKYDNVYVASGVTGIDALAGAPLAAMTKSAIVLTDGTVPSIAKIVSGKLAVTSVVTALGGAAVVSDAVRTGIVTGTVTAPPSGTLSVTSVSAITANSLKVVFSQAPADISKVVMTVTRATTPVPVTTTWNSAKTEAVLTGASNLAEGSYSIAVKNDKTDLGTSTVSVTEQKIAKITVTSTKLSITSANIGYATYQVFDQYQNDITTSYLANSITFQSGVGNVSNKSGLLTVTPTNGTNLIQFSSVVITGYDSTTGVSTNATLNTSTALGTLSDLKLNTLTNVDNKVLTAGDTSSTWYIDYTAKDISGNDTKDYSLVLNGLITSTVNGVQNCLTTSNSYVTAQVVEDPSDSTKAVIQVTVNSTDSISLDMPVSITAMSYSGTASTLSTTLKKASTVDSFTLMAPSYDIASGENKEIPFVSYDQDGTQLTKYTDINGTVTLTGGATLQQNVDGTASVFVQAITNTGTQSLSQTLTAVTTTGKLSTITLNIQPAVKADTFALDSSKLINAMQVGAVQRVDFGYNYGGFSVKDQYGRIIDMQGNPGTYEVLATTSGAVTAVTYDRTRDNVIAGPAVAAKGNSIQVQAATTAGSGTVIFNLVDTAETYKSNVTDSSGNVIHSAGSTKVAADLTAIDSKSATFSVIAGTDVKGYTIAPVASPIFVTNGVTWQENAYDANPYIYGTTQSGSKVVLAGPIVTNSYVDSSDFKIDTKGNGTNGGTITRNAKGYDNIYVSANKLADPAATASSCNLTVTLIGTDGLVHSLTTPIKSSTASPVASNVYGYFDTSYSGMTVSDDGNTGYIQVGSNSYNMLATGKVISRFDAAGGRSNRASVWFYAKDQYTAKGKQLAQITVVDSGTVLAAGDVFTVANDGTITASTVQAGDYVTLSGVTDNGLVKTIMIKFVAGNGGGVVVQDPTAALTAANTAIAAYEALPLATAANITAAQASPLGAQATAAITAATAAGATAAQTAPLTARVTAEATKIANAVPTGTANPYTVAPHFALVEIDGTLDMTVAKTVKATGATSGTVVNGVVTAATGVFVIDTSAYSGEFVNVQAYDANGVAVGAVKQILVL